MPKITKTYVFLYRTYIFMYTLHHDQSTKLNNRRTYIRDILYDTTVIDFQQIRFE